MPESRVSVLRYATGSLEAASTTPTCYLKDTPCTQKAMTADTRTKTNVRIQTSMQRAFKTLPSTTSLLARTTLAVKVLISSLACTQRTVSAFRSYKVGALIRN